MNTNVESLKTEHILVAQKEHELFPLNLQTSPQNNLFVSQFQFDQNQIQRKNKNNKRNVYVKGFITNLKSNTMQFRMSTLSENQLSLIGDATAEKCQYYQRDSIVNIQWLYKLKEAIPPSFLLTIQTLLNSITLIQPESRFKLVWDSLSLLSRLYYLYLIPFDLAWEDKSFIFDIYFNQSISFLMVLIFDLLISLNSAYYEYGQLETNRIKIIKHNIFRSYGLEWLSTIQIFIYMMITRDNEIMQAVKDKYIYLTLLIFLVHYKTLQEQVTLYEESLNLSKKVSSIIELCKLIAFIFYIIHLFSCFWYWIGQYSYNNYDKSWLVSSSLHENEWQNQYLQSLYYTTVTMFTIGYGDVTPQSNLEKIFTIVFILAASLQLPYSINTVGSIIQQISDYGQQKKQKLQIINKYMHRKSIPFSLQNEVRQYLHYYWQLNTQEESSEQKQILLQLSDSLQEKLSTASNEAILQLCPLFQHKFSSQCKSQLIKMTKSEIISPGTILDSQDSLIYVDKGQLNQFVDQLIYSKTKIIKAGQTLGIRNLITGELLKEKYKSIGFAILMILKRSDFLRVLKDFPDDLEIYSQIKDSLYFNKEQPNEFLVEECESCHSTTHMIQSCPLIHYMPDREKIIKKHQFEHKQQRNGNFKRKPHKNHDMLKLEIIQTQAEILQNRDQNIVNSFEYITIKFENPQDSGQQSEPLEQSIQQVPKKQKLKKIVRKLIHIDSIYPQYMMRIHQDYFMFNEYFTERYQLRLLQRKRFLFSSSNSTIYQHKLLPEIDYLIYDLQKKTEIPYNVIEFDVPKEYSHYNPRYNISRIKSKEQRESTNNLALIQKFLPYLKYPALIIQKFNLSRNASALVTYKRRKNVVVIQK